ncbi:MAG: thioredoxin-disulfide reductase [Desulfarculus sp.]|jgi:thioredoxin reductase (NADPH)|nr:MAG: thioredoxin-disulfide reductase [Desulfarculus sp.]
MEKDILDIAIIGGGPAGLTAGLYAARSRLKVVMLEKLAPGGQVLTTEWVENYPGFPQGVSGPELMESMHQQAERFGLVIQRHQVSGVELANSPKLIHTSAGTLQARAVIICTGAQPRKLGVEGERSFTGKGVSYCATCDGPFFTDLPIVVVGGGDTAVEEGLYLTKFGNKVYLIHRRDQLRATKLLQERVLANPKIQVVWDSVVTAVQGSDLVEGVRLRNVKTGQESELQASGVFVFVGIEPVTEFLQGQLELDKNGFIITDREMATSRAGVFAAGDVSAKSLRQIVTAVGEGAAAEFSAERFLAGC